MKIAILSPIVWRTPPLQYGPWEQVASNIAEGLVEMGADVTLFATGDSVTAGKLAFTIPLPYATNPLADAKVCECLHISYLMERAGEFDVIHNHYDFLPLTYSQLVATPMVTTIHGFSSPNILPVYQKYNHHSAYVSISYANRHPSLAYKANVYNGIDTTQFSLQEEPGSYLLFFGRIHPEKGTKEAIQLALRCGKKLVIAGLIQDEAYYEKEVVPFLDTKQVVYLGNCGSQQRNELLGNALALLHLILFEEPFGLSVVEAMCCGTPVIAFNRGAMPELIVLGKTGFLVGDMEEAEEAVGLLPAINRVDCREQVLALFSKERMARDYWEVYRNMKGR